MRFTFKKYVICSIFIVMTFNSCTSSPPPILKNQIRLTSDMIINECACGNAFALVDEQDLSKSEAPASGWNFDACNGKLITFPSAVIDLGAVYELENIHFFDANGEGKFEVYYGIPFQWTRLFEDPMDLYLKWKTQKIKIKTRYLQLKSSNRVFPAEIILEGKLVENPVAKNQVQPNKLPILKDFIGTNAFIDDPIGILAPFGSIREYHPWPDWNQVTKGDIKYNPTYQGFNFDLYYSNMKQGGTIVSPVLQQSPFWITGNKNKEAKPLKAESDPLDPASYIEHAEFMYQYAARFGSKSVENLKLVLAQDQERKSNLQSLSYFENWNEPDKWWKGRESYFTPYEYATMSSADYDGHMGTISTIVGINNADDNAKLVMAGIANPNLDYIKALKFWSDHNRNGSFPWSVINIHHYSNDGKGQFQSEKGISPEDDHLFEKMKAFVDYRNKFLPNVEVWLSEFGYDVKDDSPQKAAQIGSMSREEVQAIWIIRSYLLASAAGIDKAFQYMIRDTEGKGIYASSGLYYAVKNGESKESVIRPAWYYINCMQKVLGDMKFEKEISSSSKDVLIYSFGSENKTQKKYALWCKTSEDKKISKYAFTLTKNEKYAWAIIPTDKSTSGSITQLNVVNGKVNIDLSEKPVFIVTNVSPELNLSKDDKLLKLNKSMIVNESQGDAFNLVDEQEIIGNPDMGIYPAKPKTNWNMAYNQSFPAGVYVDLGKEYNVTKLYVNDGPGNGELVIYAGVPGNWKKFSSDRMFGYNSWKAHILNTKTRYIRLTRESANVGVFEIAVYVKE